jgi:hypothetical protein
MERSQLLRGTLVEPDRPKDPRRADTDAVDEDDRPPICPRCGVTMLPAALSAEGTGDGDWVCIECEELGQEE